MKIGIFTAFGFAYYVQKNSRKALKTKDNEKRIILLKNNEEIYQFINIFIYYRFILKNNCL